MTTISIAQPPQDAALTGDSLQALGERLAREHFGTYNCKWVGGTIWIGPDAGNPDIVRYLVTGKRGYEECACDTFEDGGDCEHVRGVKFLKRKTGMCNGCGRRFWNRELVELTEDNHDNLTYFDGDMLCKECADNAAVAY